MISKQAPIETLKDLRQELEDLKTLEDDPEEYLALLSEKADDYTAAIDAVLDAFAGLEITIHPEIKIGDAYVRDSVRCAFRKIRTPIGEKYEGKPV